MHCISKTKNRNQSAKGHLCSNVLIFSQEEIKGRSIRIREPFHLRAKPSKCLSWVVRNQRTKHRGHWRRFTPVSRSPVEWLANRSSSSVSSSPLVAIWCIAAKDKNVPRYDVIPNQVSRDIFANAQVTHLLSTSEREQFMSH